MNKNKPSILLKYIFDNSTDTESIKNISTQVASFINDSSEAELRNSRCAYMLSLWNEDPDLNDDAIRKITEDIKLGNSLEHSDNSMVSDLLFLWSQGWLKSKALDELAKHIIFNEIIGKNELPLRELGVAKKPYKKPAGRSKQDPQIYIDTLMYYLEGKSLIDIGNILFKDRRTIRDNLKKCVGDNYADVLKESHPLHQLVLKAQKIWKAKNKN